MPSSATRYELLVQALLQAQLPGVKVEHNRSFAGKKSGHRHQVDVTFTIDVAGLEVLFLVECKSSIRPVGIDEILEFSARIDDIGAHKGVIVTTTGFQEGALKVARANRIALVLARAHSFVVLMRENTKKDLLTTVAREHRLARHFLHVNDLPVEPTLEIMAAFRGGQMHPLQSIVDTGGVFDGLGEVFALCQFDLLLEMSRSLRRRLVQQPSRLGMMDIQKQVTYPIGAAEKVINDLYGPGIVLGQMVVGGISFEVLGSDESVVCFASGLAKILAIEDAVRSWRARSALSLVDGLEKAAPDRDLNFHQAEVQILEERFARMARSLKVDMKDEILTKSAVLEKPLPTQCSSATAIRSPRIGAVSRFIRGMKNLGRAFVKAIHGLRERGRR